jgi:hypothetical protein
MDFPRLVSCELPAGIGALHIAIPYLLAGRIRPPEGIKSSCGESYPEQQPVE